MKIRKYILFTIISLISFIGIAFADDSDFSLKYGERYSIGLNGYKSVTCSAEGELKALTLNKKNSSNTPYEIVWNKLPDEDGSDTIKCTWTDKVGLGLRSKKDVEKTYTVFYSKTTLSDIHIYAIGNVNKIYKDIDVFKHLINAKTITDIKQEIDGSEYVDLSKCPAGGNTCLAQITVAAVYADEVTNTVNITYVDDKGVSRNVNVIFSINIKDGATAWVGGYGTCNFVLNDDNWQYLYNEYDKAFYQAQTPNAKLPSCQADNNKTLLPLIFKGWASVASKEELVASNHEPQAIGTCANYNLVGAGATVGDTSSYYFPCYETQPGIVLSASSGTINVKNANCKKKDNEEIYVCTGTGTFTLPTVSLNGTFYENLTFKGWSNDDGKTIKSPGDSVNLDGSTYSVVIDREVKERDYHRSVNVGLKNVLNVDDMKTCAVGSNDYLTAVYSNGECLITGLKATPSNVYVDVSVSTESKDGTKNTYTYKFSVIGEVTSSEAGDGGFHIDIETNTVAGTNEVYGLNDVVASNDASDVQDIQSTICSNLLVKQKGGNYMYTIASPDYFLDDIWKNAGVADNISNNIRYREFAIIPQCDEPQPQFLSLCMDPGLVGPPEMSSPEDYTNAIPYVIDSDSQIDIDSDLGKLMTYITQKYLNDTDSIKHFSEAMDSTKVAAMIAVRLIAMSDKTAPSYSKSYNFYYGIQVAVKNAYEECGAGSGKPDLEDKIKFIFSDDNLHFGQRLNDDGKTRTNLGNKAFYEEIRNKTVDMLVNYNKEKTNSDNSDNSKFERVIDKTEMKAHDDGKGYTVIYTGSFKLPKNMTFDSSSHKAGDVVYTKNGAEGTLDKLSKNNSASTIEREVWDYQFSIDVDLTEFENVPKTAKEKREYSLTLKYKGGINLNNLFIAHPADNSDYQRMLVFNLESNDLYVYFDIAPTSRSICTELDILDSKNCTDDNNCSLPSFNKDAFVELGCCKFELDDTSYVSQDICTYSNSKCTSSTFSNVCKIDFTNSGSVEKYSIKEGAKYINGEFKDNIGTCIVDVKDNYAKDYVDGNVSKYKKTDDRGNSIMVSSYNGNPYCQVSCREEWDITMNSFGNFVGEHAVNAGMYFQNADNDIFIGKTETCYTTYIDYDKYLNDAAIQSQIVVDNYNEYSHYSHIYTDIVNQESTSEGIEWNPVKRCSAEVKKYTCKEGIYDEQNNTCIVTKIPNSYGVCESGYTKDTNGNCTKSDSSLLDYTYVCDEYDESLGYFAFRTLSRLQDLSGVWVNDNENSALKEMDEGQGRYIRFDVDLNRNPIIKSLPTPYFYRQQTECSVVVDSSSSTDNTHEHVVQKYVGNCLAESKTDIAKAHIVGNLSMQMMNAYNKMKNAMTKIKNYTEYMYNCQHFGILNTTDETESQKPNSYKLFGNPVFVPINSTFDPYVSYEYDELAYMTILQEDNILVKYTDLNNEYMENNNNNNKTNNSVNIYKNVVTTNYYNPSGMWAAKSAAAKNYGEEATKTDGNYVGKKIVLCELGKNEISAGANSADNNIILDYRTGDTNYEWTGGGCYEYELRYIPAHYIKTSLANSSFYRNKGIWYKGPDDIKEHGETLEEAWANASKRTGGPSYANEDPTDWSVFSGTLGYANDIKGNYNIFPISITTPRNLYEYTYRFAQIGDYFDKQETGRLMGKGASSVISVNSRTCFYEVVEDICLCCGDETVTYTYDIPNAEKTITPEEFIEANEKYDYEMSKGSSSGGVLGFNTSTVSLSDLNTSSNRKLGSNWTNKAAFYYGGAKLYTNKGAVALKEIEDQGEKVYANDAEYSYILKPAALAAIRDYNDIYGYGVNYNTLNTYGRSSIQPIGLCADNPGNCKWTTNNEETMNNYVANFSHYGSKFLEDFNDILNLDYNAIGGYTNLTSYSNVCVLVGDDNEENVVKQLNNLKEKGCRWVDYIESVDGVTTLLNPTGSSPNNPYGSTQYFRLAFK